MKLDVCFGIWELELHKNYLSMLRPFTMKLKPKPDEIFLLAMKTQNNNSDIFKLPSYIY